MNRVAIVTTALAALGSAAPGRAHHSVSMFDLGKPLWAKGTVVGVEAVNPHVLIALEQRRDDGTVQRWTLEGPGLNSFNRMGWEGDVLKVGDVIEVCGFGFKKEVAAQVAARLAFLKEKGMLVEESPDLTAFRTKLASLQSNPIYSDPRVNDLLRRILEATR